MQADPTADEIQRVMEHWGAVVARKTLLTAFTRGQIERATAAGVLVRMSRGRYGLPIEADTERVARELRGVAILLTAAVHWEWAVQWTSRRPQVAVPRGRAVSADSQAAVDVRWRAIAAADIVDGWVTSRARTVLDCAALLAWPEALCVADSALRSKRVTREELVRALPTVPGQRRPRVARVIDAASAKAANPLESVLRALCLEVGLDVRPQVTIEDQDGWVGRVDLADVRRRIVVEADGATHLEKHQLERDHARDDRLVVDGWIVLRFTWEQVMRRPDWVRRILARAIAQRLAA